MSKNKKTTECIELKQFFEELLLLRDKYKLEGLISIDDLLELLKSLAEEIKERNVLFSHIKEYEKD